MTQITFKPPDTPYGSAVTERRRFADPARQSCSRHPGARPPAAEIRNIQGALVDLKDIKGQESAKRALEVAAARSPQPAGSSVLVVRHRTALWFATKVEQGDQHPRKRGECSRHKNERNKTALEGVFEYRNVPAKPSQIIGLA